VSRRLLVSYLSLAAVVLLVLEVPLGVAYAHRERATYARALERDAVYAGSLAEDTLQSGGDTRALRQVASRYGDEEDARLVIVDRDGRPVTPVAPWMRALLRRPEVARALAGTPTTGTGAGVVFAAVPVASSGVVHGATIVGAEVEEVDGRVHAYVLRLGAIAAVVLALVALVGWLLARSVVRPLQAVEQAVADAGSGDLAARAPETAGPAEVRALARTFNDMAARLELLLRSQEEFVADASHQLRTPLTGLRLRLENGDVDGALHETERLARLVDGLLALARAEAAPAETRDLGALVRERLDAWEPAAHARQVRLSADVRGAALVNGDRFAQVLDNLIANALEAAPAGSTVTLVGDPEALHVRDEGDGMTEEELARAFDRFWSKAHGSGLGLPIARRLLAADGGEIELSCGPEHGLDVVLRLRRATGA